MKHPIQKTRNQGGVLRFVHNDIVCRLLSDGPFDMNSIARWDVDREDREQFAQLTGYSLAGAADLSFMSRDVVAAAYEDSSPAALIKILEDRLSELKRGLAGPVAELFDIHPKDLGAT